MAKIDLKICNFVILLLPLIFPIAASSITSAAAPFRRHRSMSLSHSKSQCYKSSTIDSPLNDSFEEKLQIHNILDVFSGLKITNF
ncbi:transmembrane protein, putative [Medicago truncatula]|uniref:Transmembrane protein, putative n=1 Tax=Medicago truncatula TaxID=3880 RepID=A0A072UK83_MEDTR|nr:transmembrane protein, putative [Medicago truncatula]